MDRIANFCRLDLIRHCIVTLLMFFGYVLLIVGFVLIPVSLKLVAFGIIGVYTYFFVWWIKRTPLRYPDWPELGLPGQEAQQQQGEPQQQQPPPAADNSRRSSSNNLPSRSEPSGGIASHSPSSEGMDERLLVSLSDENTSDPPDSGLGTQSDASKEARVHESCHSSLCPVPSLPVDYVEANLPPHGTDGPPPLAGAPEKACRAERGTGDATSTVLRTPYEEPSATGKQDLKASSSLTVIDSSNEKSDAMSLPTVTDIAIGTDKQKSTKPSAVADITSFTGKKDLKAPSALTDIALRSDKLDSTVPSTLTVIGSSNKKPDYKTPFTVTDIAIGTDKQKSTVPSAVADTIFFTEKYSTAISTATDIAFGSKQESMAASIVTDIASGTNQKSMATSIMTDIASGTKQYSTAPSTLTTDGH